MKELKSKEIIIGLVILIILCILSLVLIIRREVRREDRKNDTAVVEEIPFTQEEVAEEAQVTEVGVGIPQEEPVVETPVNELAIEEAKDVVVQKAETTNNVAKKSNEASMYHTQPQLKEYTGEELWQLEEIYNYWMEYKLDAVDDLIHLPRVRTITNELSGTNYFYYYGQTDGKGTPNGTGIAVYADNAYYCGSWQNGKRSGEGMYWKIYPDKTGTLNGVDGVVEHMYNGSWANDYPNGEGQEHISYDFENVNSDNAISNVIGNFVDGYYDGEVYIMTVDGTGNPTDWITTAKKGVFEPIEDVSVSAMGKKAVWENTSSGSNKENHYWLSDEENKGYGIFGLKKASAK